MSVHRELVRQDADILEKLALLSREVWDSVHRDPREDIHALFQYPAMMVPNVQRKIIEAFVSVHPTIKDVFDPYVGASTTMTACMHHGLNFTGQDINPLAILISKVKAGPFFVTALVKKKQELLEKISIDFDVRIEADYLNLNKWFSHELQVELSRIVRAIRSEKALWARRFFWVCLAETIRVASNDRTSTYKLHIRPASEIEMRNINAISVFKKILHSNYQDLVNFRNELLASKLLGRDRYTGQIDIKLMDTRKGINSKRGESFDLLVTSPPYGDNLTTVSYGQHSFLPLQWVDFQDIDASLDKANWLRTTQEIDRNSLGGGTLRGEDLLAQLNNLRKISKSFDTVVSALDSQPVDRRARVTSFMSDFYQSLLNIVKKVKSGAYMVWIVGNRHVGGVQIPFDKILSEMLLLEAELVTSQKRDIAFRRMAHRNQIAKMMREENVLIFRKK